MNGRPRIASRSAVLAVVLGLLALPALATLTAALSFHVQNRNTGSIVSSGERREYILYVPLSYDPSKPAPLVISMHGAGAWPVQQRNMSRWNRLADREGFLVVYPAARGRTRVWRVNRSGGRANRDVRFISDLIDAIGGRYNIDRERIHANGFSNGGGMAFVLSCMLSDRIASVGMVGSAQTLPWSWCSDERPVPLINIHGTADTAAPYEGGRSWVSPNATLPFPPVETWTANWARRNHCDRDPIDTSIAPDVTRRSYAGCDADVVLYTIHDGGHTWPGGEPLPEWFLGTTSNGIDASAEMWAFFREHPLQADGSAPR